MEEAVAYLKVASYSSICLEGLRKSAKKMIRIASILADNRTPTKLHTALCTLTVSMEAPRSGQAVF